MAQPFPSPFLSGVIEGFYGPPWSPTERAELLEWMGRWRLNTYLYAPKDDLKHRAAWRQPYDASECATLGELIGGCTERGIRFIYALSPGLDICFSDPAELERLRARCQQMLALGCDGFALLFDDIPDQMRPEDQQRWSSFAAAQCSITNALYQAVRESRSDARFLFCPTPYCQRMADRGLGGSDYLDIVGRELAPEIDVFWTGPEIVSREISVTHVRDLQRRLRRRPLIWDNLHANDYDVRRFYCGPYSGRSIQLRGEVSGILCNPNCEFPLNYVPLRTFAAYLSQHDHWEPRSAYLAAMAEWLPRFETIRGPATLDDLLFFGDCYYLPHEEGPLAELLYGQVRDRLGAAEEPGAERSSAVTDHASGMGGIGFQPVMNSVREAAGAGVTAELWGLRLRHFCAGLAELRDRPLFYALHRRAWELREELDLLIGYLRRKEEDPQGVYRSDFHLPRTYRGGIMARLQRLLVLQPDGSFVPANTATGSSTATT